MKNNLLFSQTTALGKTLGKRLVMVLTMLLIVGVGNAWGAKLTLNNLGASLTSTSNTSVSTTTIKATGDNTNTYVINYLQCKKQSYSSNHAMLLAKGMGAFISNKTAMPGNIKSVTVYVLTNAAKATTYHCAFSTTECTEVYTTGSTAVNITGGNSNKYTCTVSNAKYFCVSLGNSNNGQVYKIDVEYEEAASCTTAPTVSAASNSNITSTTATVSCSGGITSLGSTGCSITSYGFVYGTTANPTTSNTKVQVGTTYTTTGTAFSKGLTGLTANTTYYVRPYATNGFGTAYGAQTSFKTLELPKYTVTLVPGSGSVPSTTLTESSAGAGVTLPTPTLNGCDEWSFAGWKTSSAVTLETTTKPTLIPAGAYNPASNITLYAVYQRTEETEGVETTTTTTDILTRATTGITSGAGYGTWSGKTSNSLAVYAGQSAGGNDAIQLRTTNSNSGIITTASGGKAKKVTVEWQSSTANGRTLDIYGKNSAYSAATDLYDNSKQGTKLGSIVNGTSTTLTITDDYEYIGLRSNSNAMYLTSISIDWATSTGGGTSSTTYYHSTPECATETSPSLSASESSLSFGEVTINSSKELTFNLNGSDLTADATLVISGTNAGMFSVSPTPVTPSNGSITNQTITVTYTPTTKTTHTATLTISSSGADDVTVTLSGTGKAQTATYTVKHYQQNITDDYYTLKEEQTLSGEVRTDVTPAVKSYTGFTAPSTQTVTIAADGSTVVEYKYTRDSYTLTWNVNGGNDLTGTYTSGSVKFGATITKPADPTREDYRFIGWHDGTAIVDPATTMPANDLTYTAQWTQLHTITWMVGGSELTTGSQNTSVENGKKITAIPDAPDDNTLADCGATKFIGWSKNNIGSKPVADAPNDLFKTVAEAQSKIGGITENKTFHAVFATAKETTGGTIEASLSFASTAQRDSWSTSQQVWTQNGVTLTNNRDSGSEIADNSNPARFYKNSEIIVEHTSSKITKIVFDCNTNEYATALKNSIVSINGTVSSSSDKVTVAFTNAVTSFTVTLSSGQVRMDALTVTAGGGTITTYSNYVTNCCATPVPTNGSYTSPSGTSVTLTWDGESTRYHITCTNPIIDDHTESTSYNVSSLTECEEYTFYVSAHPTDGCESEAITITAQPFSGAKTVTFNYNGNGQANTTSSTSCGNTSITLPTPTYSDYRFMGWFTAANGGTEITGTSYTPTADITLFAHWEKEYTVTYNTNGGSTSCTSGNYIAGETVTICTTNPTKTGYTFAGWTYSPSVTITDGKFVMPASDVTITAQWTINSYTVTWNPNGGKWGESTANIIHTYDYGATINRPADPTRDGYRFTGWNAIIASTMPATNITYTAQWKQNYTITFHDGDDTTPWTQTAAAESIDLNTYVGTHACGEYNFAGWSTASTQYNDQTANITTWVTGTYTPTANIHLYAVYVKGDLATDFTLNCAGGVYEIWEKGHNQHMAGRQNGGGDKFYTTEYWDANNSESNGAPFTITKVADQTYTLQNADGQYITRDSYYEDELEIEETWENADRYKWTISNGTNGTWRFTNKAATSYALVYYDNRYFELRSASSVTAGNTTTYDLELTPAQTNVYQSNPYCGAYTITFETHGGVFIQGNYAYPTAVTSNLTGKTTSQFPAAELDGYTFAGWKDGTSQDDINYEPILQKPNDYLVVSSNKTYHAVYYYYDEEEDIDWSEEFTTGIYAEVNGTKYFLSGTPSSGTMSSTIDCGYASEVTVTPGTGENTGKYKITVNGKDMAPKTGKTDLVDDTFWWTITETSLGSGEYKISGETDRNVVLNNSSFGHYAYNAQGSYNGNYYYPRFGKCLEHHWTSNPPEIYTLTWNVNGGDPLTGEYTTGSVEYGTTIIPPANPTRTGYTFAGWGAEVAQTMPDHDLVYIAQWTANTYTITLDQQEGTGGSESIEVTYDAELPAITVPTREGYTFGGYFTSENGEGTQYYNQEGTAYYNQKWDIASTATLYAKWTAHTYTVIYNANNGVGEMNSQDFIYDVEQALSANQFTRVGYSFAGWNDKANGSGNSYADQQVVKNLTATKGGQKTLYAQWAAIHTITWLVNGSQAEGDPTTSVVNGQTITTLPTTPDVDCNGKVFVGWTTATIHGETATAPDPLYTELGNFPAVTSNMTFYAVFANGSGDERWVETEINDIEETDEVVVAMQTNDNIYAMYINNDATATPEAIVVEPSDFLTSGIVIDLIWFIEKDGNGNLIIHPKKDIEKNLYCNPSDNNDRVRVGKSAGNHELYKTFEIDGNYLKNSVTQHYIGVNFTHYRWYGYANNSNFPDQTLKFYKKTIDYTAYTNYSTSCMAGEFDITNANPIYVTSAVGQKIKATDKLVLTTTDMAVGTEISLSAPNITFYKKGVEITQLTTAAASETFELEIAYQPTIANTTEQPTITLEILGYQFAFDNKITGRSLPETFAIVAKVGNIWYALPSQGLNSETTPVGYPVEVDNNDNPTAVTAVPVNADWSLRQVYASSGTNDRFAANGDNLVFVNADNKTLYASKDNANIQTYAEYTNYAATNPGLYEWTPTTTDLETYTLTNAQRTDRTLNVATNTVFGVHSDNKATTEVRFLPITGRYTPAALQVVEWKENSVVIMYNGDPAQYVSVSSNFSNTTSPIETLSSLQKDIAIYELPETHNVNNATQALCINIGTEKTILSIPYIINSETTDADVLPGSSIADKQEVAKVSDLVILKGATLTAAGAKGNPYKFRNVTIYGGGKLVIPSEEKGFGVASLTLRAGGITDAVEYDYVYPQFDLRGTFTNSAAKINYDYITDYDHWFHLVLPFNGDLGTIKYPTEFYGANVAANNTGSWQIKRYAGEIRATGNYNAWVDIETEGKTSTTAGQGYIFWGAPKKVSVNGGASTRQKWGIQRITMSVTADDAEKEKADKILTGLSSHEDVANNSGKANDQGWNLIGNPYMVNLTTMSDVGLKAGKLVEEKVDGIWTGKWINNGDNLRYLTIPSEHFDTYEAKTVSDAISANALVPGRAFFVQLDGEANGITFTTDNRASLMPALLADNSDKPVDIETGIVLSNETLQDEVNFWIKDGKTNDYEYNADYPKTPNNTNFNIYGVHTNGDLSWVAINPILATESMPIGYQVPAAGTYMLSLSETYYSEDLESLYLTDHAMSPEVTVDLINAPYEFSVNQAETNNERFTISLKLKSENQGPTTGWENIDVGKDQSIKFIHQDRLYILRDGVIYDATGQEIQTINK